MKFAGLILICAASSLALLLPALGVVKFPMLNQNQQGNLSTTSPTESSIATGVANATGQGIGSDTAGMLVAAQLASQSSPQSSNGSDPAVGEQGLTAAALGKLPFTEIPTQRVGLGVWLFLLPVLFLGLALWTFGSAPSPKSARRSPQP